MNMDPSKINSPPKRGPKCTNPIPVNNPEKFTDGVGVNNYIMQREPRAFDSCLVEMLYTVSSHDFMACKSDAISYAFELITFLMERTGQFYEAKHPDRPEPKSWNLTQTEIDDLPKSPKDKNC